MTEGEFQMLAHQNRWLTALAVLHGWDVDQVKDILIAADFDFATLA